MGKVLLAVRTCSRTVNVLTSKFGFYPASPMLALRALRFLATIPLSLRRATRFSLALTHPLIYTRFFAPAISFERISELQSFIVMLVV